MLHPVRRPLGPPRLLRAPVLLVLAASWLAAGHAGAVVRAVDAEWEEPSAWTLTHPGRLRVSTTAERTHGTPRALVLAWRRDLGAFGDAGRPATPQVVGGWLPWPGPAGLRAFTRLTFRASVHGGRHGFLQVVLSSAGPNRSSDAVELRRNCPLDAGAWNECAVILDRLTPDARARLRWLGLQSVNVGHLPDESAELQVVVDAARLSDAPPRKSSGWEPDPTVLIVNQLGFRPHDEKSAITLADRAGSRFVVRDLHGGTVRHSGTLRTRSGPLAAHAVADFTALTRPGRYRVEAGGVSSLPFRIASDAYAPAIEALTDWVFDMRCGQATRLHPACHLDDALQVEAGPGGPRRRSIDLSGGWHDAGDLRTYYQHSCSLGYLALRARRESPWRRDRDGDGVDDLLDTARWALLHLTKIHGPDAGPLFRRIRDRPDDRTGNHWTDNVRGTGDDRRVSDEPESPWDVAAAAATAGLAARTPELAATPAARHALRLSEARWLARFATDVPGRSFDLAPLLENRLGYQQARWGRAGLELHLATGKPVYMDFVRRCAELILKAQRRDFHAGPTRLTGDVFPWARHLSDRDLPEELLADLTVQLADDPDALTWRAALVRFAEWWAKPVRRLWDPYALPQVEPSRNELPADHVGAPLEVDREGHPTRLLVPAGGRDQLPDTALALHRTAVALQDPELQRLALRQLQWVIGRNPCNLSWITGLGQDSLSQHYSFAQGRMPGSVSAFGVNDAGRVDCIRDGGGEPWVSTGARLAAAFLAVTSPSRHELTVTREGAPWTAPIVARWPVDGEIVAEAIPDPQGRVTLELDGGQVYELTAGGVTWPLVALSGTTNRHAIDLARIVVAEAEAPAEVGARQKFTLRVHLRNVGTGEALARVRFHGEDCRSFGPPVEVTLGPGRSHTAGWTAWAGTAGRPYVGVFALGGDAVGYLHVTGAIVQPEGPSPR